MSGYKKHLAPELHLLGYLVKYLGSVLERSQSIHLKFSPLHLQKSSPSLNTYSTQTECNSRIYPTCLRITKVNCIKVKSSPWAQTTTGCYSERGCNVYWVFLCLTKSRPFTSDVCSAFGCIISFLTL